MIKLSIASLIAGTIATSVGTGGAVLYNPLIVSMNIPPMVAAATTMMVVLYRSCAAMLQFIILDRILFDYAIWLGFWVVVSTALGLILINRYVEKSGR